MHSPHFKRFRAFEAAPAKTNNVSDIKHLEGKQAKEHGDIDRAWCSKPLRPPFSYWVQESIVVCKREFIEQARSSAGFGLCQPRNAAPATWQPKDIAQVIWPLKRQHAFEAREHKIRVPTLESRCLRRRLKPNPSLNRSSNGRPPSPGWWYTVHFHQPGLGGLPLQPG